MAEQHAEAIPAIAATEPVKASPVRQWYLVGVLTMFYLLSFLDRGSLNLMVNPIKADLGITDVQMSMLLGLAFLLLFSVCNIPFGYIADVFSRRILILCAVLFWSCMSAMCGFAGTYWMLFAGRTGLGVGEAALVPSSFSLIRDTFPANRRSRPFSIYQMGSVVGTGLAALIGGALYTLSASGAVHNIPILGGLKPWQFAIAVPGICGIPLAFIMLTIREPARASILARADVPSYGDMFRYVWKHRGVYLPFVAATTLSALGSGGWNGWMAAAIGRSWGLAPGEIGRFMGPISVICTPISLFTMGYIMDRLARAGYKDAPLRVVIVSQSLHLIPALLILQMPTQQAMWIMYGVTALLGGSIQVAAAAVLADLTPGRLMGKTVAVFNGIQVVFGLASGPTIYALVSQHFFDGKLAIVHAMTLCYGVLVISAVTLLTFVAAAVRRWHLHNVAA